jgi:proton-dependent oligopeptide transporter, POT family
VNFFRRHPTGFFFVFWGELAERASFYGIQALLALFLVESYGYSENSSGAIVEYFTAACYLLPLLGGWLADRYLGKYWTIVVFSVPYVAGHIILGELHGEKWLYLALALLAAGAGAVKPNTSTLMGMIYEKEGKPELLSEAFSMYYAAINVGAGVAMLALPALKEAYGYRVALMCPSILMAVALAVFAAGRRYYPKEKPGPALKDEASVQARRAVLKRLAGIFGTITLFWLVHDQMANTWIFMTRDHLNLNLVPGPHVFRLSPAQIESINPIFIVLVTPFFQKFWDWLAKRRNRDYHATDKMAIGFKVSLMCMILLSAVGFLELWEKPSAWFMIVAVILITIAELCVSVVGLEFAYREATPELKSFVMAAFLVTVFVGDSIGGFFVDKLYGTLSNGLYFAIQAVLMVVVLAVFKRVARAFHEGAT